MNNIIRRICIQRKRSIRRNRQLIDLSPEADRTRLASLRSVHTGLLRRGTFCHTRLTKRAKRTTPLRVSPGLMRLADGQTTLVSRGTFCHTRLTKSAGKSDLSITRQRQLQVTGTRLSTHLDITGLRIRRLHHRLSRAGRRLAGTHRSLQIGRSVLAHVAPLCRRNNVNRVPFLRRRRRIGGHRARIGHLMRRRRQLRVTMLRTRRRCHDARVASRSSLRHQVTTGGGRVTTVSDRLAGAVLRGRGHLRRISDRVARLRRALLCRRLHTPLSKAIFGLGTGRPNFIAGSARPVVRVIPSSTLITQIFVAGHSVNFIRRKVRISIHVSSFPCDRFNSIGNALARVNSSTLPPSRVGPRCQFPTSIALRSRIVVVGNRPIQLRSKVSLDTGVGAQPGQIVVVFTSLFAHGVSDLGAKH